MGETLNKNVKASFKRPKNDKNINEKIWPFGRTSTAPFKSNARLCTVNIQIKIVNLTVLMSTV
jgi:hypothetical protein